MIPPAFRGWASVAFCFTILAFAAAKTEGATIIAGPGETGLRAAIQAAQEGDTVMLTNRVELQSTVLIDKRITLSGIPGDEWRVSIQGSFDGEMLDLAADGIVIENLWFYGSPRTDTFRVESVAVILRSCIIMNFRWPVVSDVWFDLDAALRLERVTVDDNLNGIECSTIDATHCTFSGNGGTAGVGALTATLDGCVLENNSGYGLFMMNGNVKNCVFRYNSDSALRYDPDNGYMCLDSCLFYANPGGGAYLGEGAYASIDNCTFTRHTGVPAIIVDQAHDLLFRHCTVSDNVVITAGETYPYYPPGAAFWVGSYTVKLENCLVADNPTAEDPHASGLFGDWTDGGGNVIGGPAHLSTLRDNGGPTPSLLPLPGSPAMNAGRPSDVVRDARGLSRSAGAAPDAGAIETGAGPVADTDADGMPDIWERLHALNPADPADASSDTDRDGQTALAEFQSGTNPADRQSVHRVDELVLSPMSAINNPRSGYVKWTRYPGVFYWVEVSNDLRTWRRVPQTAHPDGASLWLYLGHIHSDTLPTFYRVIALK